MIIKRLKNVRFTKANGALSCTVTGWALYEEGKGYYAFSHDRKFGLLLPYMPCGGRKALQAIVDAGGFLSMEGMEFVQPDNR